MIINHRIIDAANKYRDPVYTVLIAGDTPRYVAIADPFIADLAYTIKSDFESDTDCEIELIKAEIGGIEENALVATGCRSMVTNAINAARYGGQESVIIGVGLNGSETEWFMQYVNGSHEGEARASRGMHLNELRPDSDYFDLGRRFLTIDFDYDAEPN